MCVCVCAGWGGGYALVSALLQQTRMHAACLIRHTAHAPAEHGEQLAEPCSAAKVPALHGVQPEAASLSANVPGGECIADGQQDGFLTTFELAKCKPADRHTCTARAACDASLLGCRCAGTAGGACCAALHGGHCASSAEGARACTSHCAVRALWARCALGSLEVSSKRACMHARRGKQWRAG